MSKTNTVAARIPEVTKERFYEQAEKLGFKPNDVLAFLIQSWANDPHKFSTYDILRRSEETAALMRLLDVNLRAVEMMEGAMPKEVATTWAAFMDALKEHVVAQVPALIEKLKEEQKVTA